MKFFYFLSGLGVKNKNGGESSRGDNSLYSSRGNIVFRFGLI